MRVVKLYVAASIALALGTVRLSAQEVIRPGRDPQFLSQPSLGIFDAVTNKLVKDRTRYSFKDFSHYELFPHSQSLHQGDKAWKSHFSEIVTRRPISGKWLTLAGTGAAAGDVVLLEGTGASKPLILVYVGENRFPDNSKQFSFFVFPYSARGGLELNTMPPRFHRKLLEQYELLKPADDSNFKYATATNQHGLTIDWLKSPPVAGSRFLRSSWCKNGAHFRVLRAMSLVYSQSTGSLTLNGTLLGMGYSGTGRGRNEPDLEHVPNVGPIPRGSYRIGKPRDSETTGPYVLDLTPIDHDAHGRTAFQIHGDNIGPDASHGCIVLSREIREQIVSTGVTELVVER